MRRVVPLPTMLTLGNLVCGFSAMTMAMRATQFAHDPAMIDRVPLTHQYAVGLIFLAMVCDVLDGRVARLSGMTSRFGAELDSLADVVSFGVAPALLAKSLMDIHWPPFASLTITRLGWVMLALFAAGAAVRLARYNVEAISPSDGSAGGKGKDYFVGLPSPAAAGMAVSPVLLYHWLTEHESGVGLRQEYARWLILLLPPLMLGLAWLMVSRVRYMHLGNRLFTGRQRLWPVLGVLAAAVFTVRFWELAGTVLFGAYVVGFLVWDLARTARSARQRRRGARPAAGGPPPGGSPAP